jgi:hypothetical protein
MQAIRVTILLILATVTLSAVSVGDSGASFDHLKALAGAWEGKASNGQTVHESYKVTSGGSAVMSEISGEENMITMFHMDGDNLVMTHYCTAGNQPRMKASTSAEGKTITFDFMDATNLVSPDAGHMHRAVFSLADADHLTEDWYFADHGKEMHEHFDLERKK